METSYKIGDLVCRTDLYTQYYLNNKKVDKKFLNIAIGTIVHINGNILSIKLMNDSTVYSSKGAWMKLDSRIAESLEINE